MHAGRQRHQFDRATLRQAQLLGALIIFHLASPVIATAAPQLAIAALLPLYALVLVAASFGVVARRASWVILVLGVPILVAAIASITSTTLDPLIISVAALPFLACTAIIAFRAVIADGMIDAARLLGSASVFILLAQVWAGIYAALEWASPGSFAMADETFARPSDLAYFSFVTQTTLGYGDIVPATHIARAAATLQATTGLFYMGVVVARFAGRLRVSSASDHES